MKYLIALLAILLAPDAYAQSTAEPLQMGFLSTASCPGGATVCFIPYSSTNPAPVAVIGGSGDTSGFVLTSNGPGNAATFQVAGGAPGVNTASTITQVGCSATGNAFFTQPITGTSYKLVSIRLAACSGTASYSYPTPFINTPGVVATGAVAAGIVTTNTAAAVTITGTTNTGFLFIEGN
jgi:hypothetical protein